MDKASRKREENDYIRLRRQFGDVPADIEDAGEAAEIAYLRNSAQSLTDDQLIRAVTSYSLG